MHKPPLLPAERLKRVLKVAWADAWSVIVIAGLSGLLALWQRERLIAAVCLLVLFGGMAELHGRRRLVNGDPRGRGWLVGAQLLLLVVILAYARHRWVHFEPEVFWAELPASAQAMLDQSITAQGLDPENDRWLLLEGTNRLVCAVLAVVTVFYQGGLAIYYLRQARLAPPEAAT